MYVFKWREELFYAAAVFLVYMATAYVATGEQPVTDWGEWLTGTIIAASRVAVAALAGPLIGYIQSRREG